MRRSESYACHSLILDACSLGRERTRGLMQALGSSWRASQYVVNPSKSLRPFKEYVLYLLKLTDSAVFRTLISQRRDFEDTLREI